jgi:hypothetical protein
MPGTGLGVTTIRGVVDDVVAAIRRNPDEFFGGVAKVSVHVFINGGIVTVEVIRPRVIGGLQPTAHGAAQLLPADIDALAAEVRTELLAVAPASRLPKRFIIDIFPRGPRPHVEVTTKA